MTQIWERAMHSRPDTAGWKPPAAGGCCGGSGVHPSLGVEQEACPQKPHTCPASAFPTTAVTPRSGWQEAPSRHSPHEWGRCIQLTLPTSRYHSWLDGSRVRTLSRVTPGWEVAVPLGRWHWAAHCWEAVP